MSTVDPLDRAEAAELLARYAECLDAGDFAAVGALFADAVLVDAHGAVVATGSAEIAAAYERTTRRFDDGTPRTSHVITNVLVEPCADDEPGELEMRSRFTVFQASDGLALQPIVVGRYVDRVSRRGGRMAFVRRSIQPQLWGDVTAHLWDVPAAAAGVDRALRSRVEQLEAERAVLDLVNRYGATLDDGDEDGFVACFTDDGAFVSTLPNLALDVRGAEALRAYAASHTRAPARIHKHCVFDSRIDLDVEAGTGRVVSYFARLDLLADGPSIVAFGRYRDRVVRTPAGWRFARREIAIEALRRPS